MQVYHLFEVFIMSLTTLTIFFAAHFIGDFILQNDWMAMHKSSSIEALSVHALIYATIFTLPFLFSFPELEYAGLCWILILIIHGSVDAVTSRISSRLWKTQNYRLYFNMIGLDQMTHMIIQLLILSHLGVR